MNHSISGRLASVAIAAALACLAAPAGAGAAQDTTTWLCKPGITDNPCAPQLDTAQLSPTGQVVGTDSIRRDRHPKVDCFYVYPTVSDDKSPNSDLSVDPEERSIALYQASRYRQYCRIFAPMYRQVTLQTLLSGQPITAEQSALGYADVLSAWKTYLKKYNRGRGVILIGHSQGSFVLRKLIADTIDGRRSIRKRLISALLLGGNVEVKEGGLVGGDFEHVRGCSSPKQLHCVVGFSTYNAPVPADSKFGRVGAGLSSGDPALLDILCTNPAALGGGASAPLKAIFPTAPFAPGTTIGAATELVGVPRPPVSTTWYEYDGAYTGACSSAGDADVLQVAPIGGAPILNAVPDPTWGLHLVDANIALGNLTDLVRRQIKRYAKATPR